MEKSMHCKAEDFNWRVAGKPDNLRIRARTKIKMVKISQNTPANGSNFDDSSAVI